MHPREIPTQRGIRLVQHNVVLSEVLREPGPTHSAADLLAAIARTLAPQSTIALLGFAAGGMIAPLRAMGGQQEIRAVDINGASFGVFERLCRQWSGRVEIELAEAQAWLRGRNTRYDMIIEDLSVPAQGDVFKPEATWSTLPGLIRSRLNENGIGVFNLLRPQNANWATGLARVTEPFESARVVLFDLYENRIVIAARNLPPVRQLSLELRHHLRFIRSKLARTISIRSCPTGAAPSSPQNSLTR